ncbi:hypothetical protein F5148DRAFT_1189156 [Russula earlei]|uniref:Uncharacterized protein n=1 Tax=Russula earlei TaxID=71964 RepID=A0ACC0UC40_9AGAM|nr:hypothetical protein F5148DRAFT_1189156 [Russula earlei]
MLPLGSPLVRPNIMSSHLPTGLYTITNVGQAQSAGHDLTRPTVKPIIGTDDKPIWVVEHTELNFYRLTLHGFVTKAEENLVWSYLEPEIVGARWELQQSAPGSSTYSIVDTTLPPSRYHLVWALKERDAQVSLDVRLGRESGPNELWLFEPVNPE